MNLPFQPTFNSIVMILIGLTLLILAVFMALNVWTRLAAAGFFFTGIGNILSGLTNGFTDMTPVGRNLFRIALVAYIIGIPLIIYFLYGQMNG